MIKMNIFPFFAKNKSKEVKSEKASNVSMISSYSKDKGEKKFLDAKTILNSEIFRHRISQIKENVGVNDDFFDQFFMPVISGLASRFQSCPASKAHHHSFDYGLLEHSLEVAVFAVRQSNAYNYFPDQDEEKIQHLIYVYQYCVFIGAMLHDAAKVMTDCYFKIYINNEWVHWSPLYASVPDESDNVPFRIFRRENATGLLYKKNTHELAASMLLTEVVPSEGIKWILDFTLKYAPPMFTDLVHTVASDYKNGGLIGLSVEAADRASTKRSVEQMDTPATTSLSSNQPIHLAYKAAFSELLKEIHTAKTPYNKRHKGENSHIERFGNLIFLSAKTMTKKANKLLIDMGYTLPSENKISTILCENNVALPTPKGDTLWWITFFDASADTSRTKDIAYLVFKVSDLDAEHIPSLPHEEVLPFFSKKVTGLQESMPFPESLSQTIYDQLYPPIVSANSNAKTPATANVEAPEEVVGAPVSQKIEKPDLVDTEDAVIPHHFEGNDGHEPTPSSEHDETEENSLKPSVNDKDEAPLKDDTESNDDDDGDLFSSFGLSALNAEHDSKANKSSSSNANDHVEEEPAKPHLTNDESEIVQLTEQHQQILSHVNSAVPYWLSIGNQKRKNRASIYDKECLESLFPFIQQMIDSNQIDFNRKNSPIHYTKYGLFIVSPQFFKDMSKSRTDKFKRALKRSQFIYMNGDVSIIEMETQSGNEFITSSKLNRVKGFLVNYHSLMYNGSPLPENGFMNLVNDMSEKDTNMVKETKKTLEKPLTAFNFKP